MFFLRRSIYKISKFITKVFNCAVESLILVKQFFMFCYCIFCYLAAVVSGFKLHTTIMSFDGLFQIVNIDKLNVKLVVVMLYIVQQVFREILTCSLLKLFVQLIQILAVGTQRFSPGIAFPGEL